MIVYNFYYLLVYLHFLVYDHDVIYYVSISSQISLISSSLLSILHYYQFNGLDIIGIFTVGKIVHSEIKLINCLDKVV